jgi:sulfate adenylyltransferase subunit 1 (EFTu-like GTPase family)
VSYIPLSALTGDNVVDKADAMPWYKGQRSHPGALEPADMEKPFPVQTVIRPKQKNTMTLEDMPVNCTEIILKRAVEAHKD